MLKFIEEYAKYVEITGFKNTKILDVDELCERTKKERKVEIQFFDAQKVATWEHLYFAALNTLNVFKERSNVSRSPAIEMMRFASARRQIREAMSTIGIKAGFSNIAVTIVGNEEKTVIKALNEVAELIGGKRDDTVLELTPKKMKEIEKTFDLSAAELEVATKNGKKDQALLNLVLERMALVSTQR